VEWRRIPRAIRDELVDPGKPMIELSHASPGGARRRLAVAESKVDSDHHGWYEIWECTAVEKNAGHQDCEDPRHSRTMDQRATRTRSCSDPSHVARVGRYIVRESHYRRAFQRRGASQRRRARKEQADT
jgi:hypothetical protein